MENLSILEQFLQTLGDTNRLKIIKFIGEKECSVSEIVNMTGLSQPLVSHHLKNLRNGQILETQRKGPFVFYKLKNAKLLSALDLLLEVINLTYNRDFNSSVRFYTPWFGEKQVKN